jgi:hypothetical protein
MSGPLVKPTMGRIVFYRNLGEESPAIITLVHGNEIVNLTVFKDGLSSSPVSEVPHEEVIGESDEHVWRWPPREDLKATRQNS